MLPNSASSAGLYTLSNFLLPYLPVPSSVHSDSCTHHIGSDKQGALKVDEAADMDREADEEAEGAALLGSASTVCAETTFGQLRRRKGAERGERDIAHSLRVLVPVVLLSFFLGATLVLALFSHSSAGVGAVGVAGGASAAADGVEEKQGGERGNSSNALAAAAAALLLPMTAVNVSNCSLLAQSAVPVASSAPPTPTSAPTAAAVPIKFNFSVDPVLPPSRWPSSIDPLQPRAAPPAPSPASSSSAPAAVATSDDPFAAFSPGRFNSSLRGVVISMFTPGQSGDLTAYFADNDRLFLSPMSAHSDYVIFHTLFPASSGDELHSQLTGALKCEELTVSSNLTSRRPDLSDIYSRLRHPLLTYPLYLPAVREFLSPLGTHIITVPVAVNLPAHVASDVGQMLRRDWMGCMGVRRSLDYALFSGAVFPTHLIFHPLLRGYDYFVKLDLDISFLRLPPSSMFEAMQRQQCVWMHTQYNSGSEDCELEATEAVNDWANRTHHVAAASAQRSWWGSLHYFYGNLVGGWLGWLSSAENQQLATFLYEDSTRPGYFSHRWGDQPTFAKMLGMWFDLTDEQVRGYAPSNAARWRNTAVNGTAASNDTSSNAEGRAEEQVVSAVCDFTYLRHVAFEHH